VQTTPAPINVAIISEAPSQQKTLVSAPKPHLDTPTMHIPQPDIVLANAAPSAAPTAVTTAAPQPQSAPTAPVTQPIFDADYLNNPAPAYPPLARRLREQGVVYVRILVSPDGLPDHIELKHSSGSARLDEAALRVVKKWRFVPAKRGGQSVAAWVVVPIAFSLTA
jgi:protein TonB